ncbi:T-complex protein 11-like protein 2 [Cimex lectularius]|uniref:Uncharacterized protein n=1 Tax=Cimex lectularius TaxID=79782 RepID=A0A8I6SDG8_CIMLE|nr:T-complex protein 11-like protein 2 [Cimex lectularius]
MFRNPESEGRKNGVDDRDYSDGEDLIRNLSLAHEMALCDRVLATTSSDYHSESPLRDSIQFQMHQAFWDAFQEELEQDPPKLDMAYVLLDEIREKLISVMTPNVKKMKADVNRLLDQEDIKAKVEEGTFVLELYANSVISVMKRICAPIRDSDILKLAQEKVPVKIFRGIVETLDLMKIDLINYTLSAIKPDVVANDMDYERTKLAEYICRFGKGLPITRAWLQKHKNPKKDMKEVLFDAYMDLLTWPNESYPETLVLDFPKLTYLKNEYYRVIMLSSIMFIAYTFMPIKLNRDKEMRKNLKAKIKTLLSEVNDDTLLKSIIPDIVEQIKEDANRALKKIDRPSLTQHELKSLASQLLSLIMSDSKIKYIVKMRVGNFLRSVLDDKATSEIPTSLGFVKDELTALSSQFAYIVGHNYCVCSPHYSNILQS